MYGLGEPPMRTWGHEYEEGDVSRKKSAVATLEKVMLTNDDGESPGGGGRDRSVRKQLFQTPSNTSDRRTELLRELKEMDELEQVTKRTRTQVEQGEVEVDEQGWAGSLGTKERHELAEQWIREAEEMQVTSRKDGWKTVFHQQVTTRLVGNNYARQELRGLHFYTATAKYLFENPQIRQWDKTGYGVFPAEEGNHDVAEEWMGEMYAAGVKRLGGGGQFEQIQFSKTARKGLAGAGANPPDPIHLAMFFTQLFQAGEKGGRTRQTDTDGSSGGDKAAKKAHVQVPGEVLERVIAAAEQWHQRGWTAGY
jgi:hypothetical protein